MKQFYEIIEKDKTIETTEATTQHTHEELKSDLEYHIDHKSKVALWIAFCSVVALFVVFSIFSVYVTTKHGQNRKKTRSTNGKQQHQSNQNVSK